MALAPTTDKPMAKPAINALLTQRSVVYLLFAELLRQPDRAAKHSGKGHVLAKYAGSVVRAMSRASVMDWSRASLLVLRYEKC